MDAAANPLDHTGRVVIVTGGTRGVGRAVAGAYLGAGAEVVVCGRREPDELPTAGGRVASFLAADVRDPEQAAALVGDVVARHGRLDVLVNNAGGSPATPSATASPRFVTSVVTLNLLAPLFCAQAAYRAMAHGDAGRAGSGRGGVIVNVASVSGIRPSPGTAAYGAAKAGLINLTRTLAVEWAPAVRVVAVVAGLIATEAADDHYGGPDGIAAVAATVPAGRMGRPDDVAGACLFLSSPLADYASGACLVLDGGGERPAYLAAADDAGRI